jgi:secreted trypsin-like serine protease
MHALVLLLIPAVLAVGSDQKIVGGSNVNIANYQFQVSYCETFIWVISNL